MPNTLDSVPYPLTPQLLERLTAGGTFQKAHPEVITSRYSESEGSTTVVPAVLLVTDSYAYALVEADSRDGYQVLKKGSSDEEEEVYDKLGNWCEENGYL